MELCRNCNEPVDGKYCSNYGQPAKLQRIDVHYVVHEIERILHFEWGILYTIKELLISRGKNVWQFISENRSRLVKPIIFVIVTSLIYTLISQYFHVAGFINFDDSEESTTTVIFKWIQEHYGYANILMGIFIVLWSRVLFLKYDYDSFEVLILLCFVIGMQMLIFSVFAILTGLTHLNLVPLVGFVGIAYRTWAVGQFYNKKKVLSYAKALAAYVLGLVTFSLLAVQLGQLIDWAVK